MSLNDESLGVASAWKKLNSVLVFLNKMEEKYPNEPWDDEALEPIRGTLDQLCGYCHYSYQLYGKKNDAL